MLALSHYRPNAVVTARCATFGLVVALALVGCGGAKAPSKAAYLKKVNAICARSNSEGVAATRGLARDPRHPTPREAQAILAKLDPVTRESVRRSRAVKPPKGDETKVKAIYDAADQGTAAYERASKSPNASLAILNTAGTPRDPYGRANRLAKAYGLTTCAG
jgi:hypothetical protein